MSGARAKFDAISGVLCDFFGEFEDGKGGMYLSSSRVWGSVRLFFDHDPDGKQYCVLEVPGSSLGLLCEADRLRLLRECLALGCRATRLDVAVDVRGSGLSIIERMQASCRAKELCGARRFEPKEVMGQRGLVAWGCNIGQRGKDGSGRYVRCYDKGLETKTAPVGRWVRYEVEFSDDCASQAALCLGDCGDVASADSRMVELALGAVEFREANGSRSLARRAVASWWAAFVAGVRGVRLVAARVAATLSGYSRWLGDGVWRGLSALAADSKMSVGQLVEWLCGPVEPNRKILRRQVGMELRTALRQGGLVWSS
jgi:hypothetical protein